MLHEGCAPLPSPSGKCTCGHEDGDELKKDDDQEDPLKDSHVQDDCFQDFNSLAAAVDHFLDGDVQKEGADELPVAKLRSRLLVLAAQQRSELSAMVDKQHVQFVESIGKLMCELQQQRPSNERRDSKDLSVVPGEPLLRTDVSRERCITPLASLARAKSPRGRSFLRHSDRPSLKHRLHGILQSDVSRMQKSLLLLYETFFFWRDAEHRRMGIKGHLTIVTEDSYFDAIIGMVIVVNSFVMMAQLEWRGSKLAVTLGMKDDAGWPHAKTAFDVLEHIFALIFLIELVLRVTALRWRYFKDPFHLFDMMLVVTSCIDLYLLQPVGSGAMGNLTVIRLMRLARLFRTFRMARTLKLFGGLRVLVKAVSSSLSSLVWAMILLFILIMIAGLLMVNLLEEYIANPANQYSMREWAWEHYGTSSRAMYTMFEVTLSGCWPNYVRPLMNEISWWYASFFVIYVAFVVFAVIRVITAIFLKETLDAAGADAEMMVQEKAKKRAQYLEKLKAVFIMADVSGDGMVTEEEFNGILEKPIVRTLLQALELEFHEGTALFNLLAGGDGEITYDEFIQGVHRLKGQARSVDLIAMQIENQRVLHYLRYLGESLGFPEELAKQYIHARRTTRRTTDTPRFSRSSDTPSKTGEESMVVDHVPVVTGRGRSLPPVKVVDVHTLDC